MRYYGFKNNKGSVIVTDVFREDSYDLDWDLEEFIRDINDLYSKYGVLHGFKHQLRDEISSLKDLDTHFREEGGGSITCFSMIRSTLISIYERLYNEEYKEELGEEDCVEEVEISNVYFDYHDDGEDKWGQITLQDDWNVNLGVFNFDDISFEDFKKMFDLWKMNLGDDVYVEFKEI